MKTCRLMRHVWVNALPSPRACTCSPWRYAHKNTHMRARARRSTTQSNIHARTRAQTHQVSNTSSSWLRLMLRPGKRAAATPSASSLLMPTTHLLVSSLRLPGCPASPVHGQGWWGAVGTCKVQEPCKQLPVCGVPPQAALQDAMS